jgi:hypothetical protein
MTMLPIDIDLNIQLRDAAAELLNRRQRRQMRRQFQVPGSSSNLDLLLL